MHLKNWVSATSNKADEVVRVHSSQSSLTCMLLHNANAVCTIRRARHGKTNNNRIYHMAWFNFSRKAYHLEKVECRHADGTLRSGSSSLLQDGCEEEVP